MTCPACGTENPGGFRFCGGCGAPLAAAASPAGPRRDDAEHRQLTILFCDLVDSTGLSERLDLEQYRGVVQRYHATCDGALARFGGRVAQYLGDGLLVYFGYPQAHEDDAQRAVHSALEILRGIGDLSEEMARDGGPRIAVRIGVHTGPVVAGAVGSAGHSEQLAMGQTPNVAARLQALADPGTIVVSGATHDLVRGFFVCEPLGPRTLRGLSRPIEAHRVLRDTGVRNRFEVALARGLVPMVDRQAEMGSLVEAFARAREGSGQSVRVVGDPGIGKSRLLQMFQEVAVAHAPLWVLCRCSPYARQSALHPVIELFEHLLGFGAGDGPAERRRKLRDVLDRHAPSRPDAEPLLVALFSLPAEEGAASLGLTPERQKERTFETLGALLRSLATERPVVVGVEDLHWADPSSLEFLAQVMAGGPTARIMFLFTHRPGFEPGWRPDAVATSIHLDRLPDEHVQAMAEHVAEGRRLPEEVHRYIAEKTDGVPIFIEELTRTVLESGWLMPEGLDAYVLTRPLGSLAIPVTLQDLLLARLDRLGGARDLALLASVVGREFDHDVLQAVTGADEAALRRDLAAMVAAGLIEGRGEPPRATYAFRHALIQDAAYSLLVTSARQHHHRRVAEVLAQRFPDVAEQRPELVAHHFTEAGLAEPAAGYWLRAARRAVARSANVEAVGHVRQGLALVEPLPSSPARDALELGLQSTLGSAQIALSGYGAPEVERAFARALELCERLGDPAQRFRAELGLWMYYVVRADYTRALDLAERMLATARRGPAPAPLVHASYCVGFTRYYLGEFEAAHEVYAAGAGLDCDDADPALLLPTGDDVRIHLLVFWAHVLWHRGRPAEAVARCEEGLALARRLGHPYGVMFAQNGAAFLWMLLGDVERARAASGESAAVATDKGYRYFLLMGGFVRGWLQARAGGAEEGLATMERAIQAGRAAGALMGQTLWMFHHVEAALRHGRLGAARARLGEMAAAVEATGERFFEPEMRRLLAACDLAEGGADPGIEAGLRTALERARAQGNHAHELRAAMALARYHADRGGRAVARELLGPTVEGYPASLDTADLREARTLLTGLG